MEGVGGGLWGKGNVNKKNTTIKSYEKKTNKAKRWFLEPTKHNQKSNAIRHNHLHNIAYQHYWTNWNNNQQTKVQKQWSHDDQ